MSREQKLTAEDVRKFILEDVENNYYSDYASRHAMSFSQFKEFCLELGGCPARAFAKYVLNNYADPDKEALVLGNLGHKTVLEPETVADFALFHEKLVYLAQKYETVPVLDADGNPTFEPLTGKQKKPRPITEKVALPREYNKKAKTVHFAAKRIYNAPIFQEYLKGDVEIPIVFELGGVVWKCKLDIGAFYYLTDLKFVRDFKDSWSNYHEKRVQWYRVWHYNFQFAVYSEALHQENIRKGLKPEERPVAYMIAASKPSFGPCDFRLTCFMSEYLEKNLTAVKELLPAVLEIKAGEVEAPRCGECHYCRSTVLEHLEMEMVGL